MNRTLLSLGLASILFTGCRTPSTSSAEPQWEYTSVPHEELVDLSVLEGYTARSTEQQALYESRLEVIESALHAAINASPRDEVVVADLHGQLDELNAWHSAQLEIIRNDLAEITGDSESPFWAGFKRMADEGWESIHTMEAPVLSQSIVHFRRKL